MNCQHQEKKCQGIVRYVMPAQRRSASRRLPPRRRKRTSTNQPRQNYRTPGARGNRTLAVLPRPVVKKGPSGVSQMMRQVFETKIIGTPVSSESAFSPTQLGSQTYVKGFTCGLPNPSSWNTAGWTYLGPNVPQAQGDNSLQYDGNYIFLKNTTIKMSLNMNSVSASSPDRTCPVQFRVVAFRAKPQASGQGLTPDPSVSLFIDQYGNGIGHATSGVTGDRLFLYNLNFRNFDILSDVVTEPMESPLLVDPTVRHYMPMGYPCTKGFSFRFPHQTKTKLAVSAATTFPSDKNTSCYVLVYCRNISQDALAQIGGMECTAFGSTSYLDN